MTLIKEIIKNAQEEKYAFGMFNTSNLEVAQGIARAAEEKKMPALIGITESAVEYAGFLPLVNMVKGVIEESSADLVMHLDHGKDPEFVKKCIDAGFESVMIDASHFEFEKNIEVTKDIVDYAHKKGATVQAELGKIPKLDISVEQGVTLAKMEKTDPDELEEFVKRTGVDTVAIIIGNIHGMYEAEGNPHLDLDLLKILRERVSTPFILHGGSGTPSEDVTRAIKECGIVSVNIDTEVRIAFITAINDFFASGQMVIDPRKVLSVARDAVQKKVEEKIELFGNL
ncbi:MAG: class II fructose-bisphosphate aldolase family protein [Candidatus Pacebacteria bacterium]|nr:class II fructose-bisphosphate aldolase family protein [Candidatus Paceibacterota bacterium]